MNRKVLTVMSKKAAAATLVGSLLVSGVLAGCSSGTTSSGKNNKVTINVWGMGEEAKSLPKIAEEFKKENPNIDVKVQAIPWDQ